MIFNTSNVDGKELEPADKNCWKLGILDLEPKELQSQPFPKQNYANEDIKAFGDQIYPISKAIVDKIQVNKPGYKVQANPTFFRIKKATSASFIETAINGITSAFTEAEESVEELVLVTPDIKDTKLPAKMLLHNLVSKKEHLVENGDIFVNFDQESNALYYIENLPNKAKLEKALKAHKGKDKYVPPACNLVTCSLDENMKTEVSHKTQIDV